jgi:polysaccharide deacetylase family protein (PEP-CTERM system associated)
MTTAKSVFSVDVEDWFHILDVPSTPNIEAWESLPSRVERNFHRLLDIFSENNVRTTCFFLGWIGKRFPHLVREADRRGHEIASHGYAHLLVHRMTAAEFYEDIATAKAILEDAVGQPVSGYRAPGFSTTEEVPWFFSKVVEAGYSYDSSVFPAHCEYGGLKPADLGPHVISTESGPLIELPMTVAGLMGKRVCVFGGGYLRLAPVALVERMIRKVHREGRPAICYVHPREIDMDHPRLPMGLRRRFKSYVNIRSTEGKIRRLLSIFEFTSFREFLVDYGTLVNAGAENALVPTLGHHVDQELVRAVS